MITEIIKIKTAEDTAGIKTAAEILKNGGLVAIPTETVYGLAANAFDENAVKNIFIAKGRPQDNPLIVHISSVEEIYDLVEEVPEKAMKLFEKFSPGPLTVILKKSEKISDTVSAGLDTVAVRMPANKIASAIIKEAGVPLAAPSANLSGSPSPTCFKYVFDDMNTRIDAIVDGGESEVGLESTVITLAKDVPTVLRPGGITVEQLREVLGEVEIDSGILKNIEADFTPASPGMKYKHYAPKADVIILRGSFESFKEYVSKNSDEHTAVLCFDNEGEEMNLPFVTMGDKNSPDEQGQRLFTALRQIDETGAKTVYARCPSQTGIGLAVCNRLFRAAAFRIIEI
ncbi:MAG: threonylcarbamoyl-AMP synthase [Clostridia bacterium]|nr:threonylcarbamoyl-AMP synthase [Clostridia bacterium]